MVGVKIDKTAVVETQDIGEGTVIGPFTYISSRVRIGSNCRISGASIGTPGEHPAGVVDPGGMVVIGNDVTIREFVTINTPLFGESTSIGHGSYLMAKSHVGHDAVLGNRVVLHTGAIVGGHSIIGNFCYIGLNSTLHPKSTMGSFCILGANGMYKGQNPTSGLVWVGVPAIPIKVNIVGLERHTEEPIRSKITFEAEHFLLEMCR